MHSPSLLEALVVVSPIIILEILVAALLHRVLFNEKRYQK